MSQSEIAAHGIHTGVPSYFIGWCRDAARAGSLGYEAVGYQLARVLAHEQPYDIEADDWCTEVDALTALLDADDEPGALQWFASHYPRMMARVPRARRSGFIEGVQRAHDEGLIEESFR